MKRFLLTDRRAALLSTHDTLQPKRSHQSLDRTAGNCDLLSTELSPGFACAVDLEVLFIDASNIARERDIAPNPGRQPLRLRLSRLVLVVG